MTPTDPVLSNVIVSGRFAEKKLSMGVRNLIVAESSVNDGLGYPFLFFALYLIRSTNEVGAAGVPGAVGNALGVWAVITCLYVIVLSVVYGAVVGWLGNALLKWCVSHRLMERESVLSFAIALTLFVLGTCGLVGTDEVLACFAAGSALSWDDWHRNETENDTLRPVLDMLLNLAIFLWYGAALPWHLLTSDTVVWFWQLVVLAVAVLLLRRLPWIMGMYAGGWIPQLTDSKQAVLMGFFGPIGVSAVYYIYVTLDFIESHTADETGVPTQEARAFGELVRVAVWSLCTCSIVSRLALKILIILPKFSTNVVPPS